MLVDSSRRLEDFASSMEGVLSSQSEFVADLADAVKAINKQASAKEKPNRRDKLMDDLTESIVNMTKQGARQTDKQDQLIKNLGGTIKSLDRFEKAVTKERMSMRSAIENMSDVIRTSIKQDKSGEHISEMTRAIVKQTAIVRFISAALTNHFKTQNSSFNKLISVMSVKHEDTLTPIISEAVTNVVSHLDRQETLSTINKKSSEKVNVELLASLTRIGTSQDKSVIGITELNKVIVDSMRPLSKFDSIQGEISTGISVLANINADSLSSMTSLAGIMNKVSDEILKLTSVTIKKSGGTEISTAVSAFSKIVVNALTSMTRTESMSRDRIDKGISSLYIAINKLAIDKTKSVTDPILLESMTNIISYLDVISTKIGSGVSSFAKVVANALTSMTRTESATSDRIDKTDKGISSLSIAINKLAEDKTKSITDPIMMESMTNVISYLDAISSQFKLLIGSVSKLTTVVGKTGKPVVVKSPDMQIQTMEGLTTIISKSIDSTATEIETERKLIGVLNNLIKTLNKKEKVTIKKERPSGRKEKSMLSTEPTAKKSAALDSSELIPTLTGFAKVITALSGSLLRFAILAPRKVRTNFLDFVKEMAVATDIIGDKVKSMDTLMSIFSRLSESLIGLGSGLRKFSIFVSEKTKTKLFDFLTKLSGSIKEAGMVNYDGFGKMFTSISSGILELATGLNKFSKLVTDKTQKSFFGLMNKFSKLAKGEHQYESFGNMFVSITKGIAKLALGLFLFGVVVSQKSIDLFVGAVQTISDKFAKIDTKKIKEGGEGLIEMARGIFWFGLALAGSAVLYAAGAIASLIIIPVIAGFSYVFAKIGEAADSIKAGAGVVVDMALGLVAFGLGLLAVKMLAGGSWEEYAKGTIIVLLGLTVFTIAFDLIGKLAPNVEKGAKAVAWMGLGLISLAFGIMSFQLLKVDISSVLIAGAAVAFVGLAFALIGLASEYIDAGALALVFSGIALASLALGIDLKQIGLVAGGIVVVGGAIALVGLAAPLIALGGLSLIVAGISMAVLALGLWGLNLIYKQAESGVLGISADGKRTNLEVVIGGVVEAFSINPVKSAFMLIGAAALVVASVAMIAIAVGIGVLGLVYMKSTSAQGIVSASKQDPTRTNLDVLISSVVEAFYINPVKSALMLVGAAALVVASIAMVTLSAGLWTMSKVYGTIKASKLFADSGQKGFFGGAKSNFEVMMDSIVDGLVINPISLAGLYLAVPAWIMTGLALVTIAWGLSQFQKVATQNIDLKKIGSTVSTVLTAVAQSFAGITKDKTIDWDSVKDGIAAVSGVGNLLAGIADGVSKMADLKFPIYDKDGNVTSYFTIGDAQFAQVSTNIRLIIKSVADTLTEVGASQGESGWFSKSNAEKGKDAIMGVAGDLIGIADFVMKVAEMRIQKYDANGKVIEGQTVQLWAKDLLPGGRVQNNIRLMIRAVTDTLTEIGKGSTNLFRKDDVEKGKLAIMGIGDDLVGIADMVKTFAEVKDYETVKKNIKDMIMMLPATFSDVYNNIILKTKIPFTDIVAILTSAADPLAKYATILTNVSKSKITGKMGQDFGDAISNLFKPLASFKEVVISTNPIGPLNQYISLLTNIAKNKITANMGDSLGSAVSGLFKSMGTLPALINMKSVGDATSYIERLAKTSDKMVKLAGAFEKIAKSMDRFSDAFKKMNVETLKYSNMFIESLVLFSKTDPNAFESVSSKGALLIKYIWDKGPQIGEDINKKKETATATVAPSVAPAPTQPSILGTKPIIPVKVEPQLSNKELMQALQDLTAGMAKMQQSMMMIQTALTAPQGLKVQMG